MSDEEHDDEPQYMTIRRIADALEDIAERLRDIEAVLKRIDGKGSFVLPPGRPVRPYPDYPPHDYPRPPWRREPYWR